MRDLVDDGVAHDVGLTSRRCAHPFDRSTKDEDAVGDVGLDRAPRGEGDALVKTEQLAASPRLLLRGIVLDDDRDVAHALAELRRELVARRWPVLTMVVGKVAHALERDLDVGWGKILRDPLRAAELPAGGARQRVALAERVEDLAAYPARRVCAERGAAIAAVPPRG